jgi:osmotically-inducible protein OsmY
MEARAGHGGGVARRGLIRRLVPVAVPLTRTGMALWAWRNRTELMDWAGFASRSVPRLQGDERGDVIVEARLRARLTNDHRTRGVEGLKVDVADGVATLSGLVTPDVHDAAVEIATGTRGVRRVRDTLRERARARWGRRS